MDVEPDPPRRPTSLGLNMRLAVAALTVLAVNLGWWVFALESSLSGSVPKWLNELFAPPHVTARLMYYAPTAVALLLVALSLVVRSRRRRAPARGAFLGMCGHRLVGVEPDPPERPRRAALDLLLMVGAMIALGALLAQGILLAFDAIDDIHHWVAWGLLTLAQLLLAASVVARLRRR